MTEEEFIEIVNNDPYLAMLLCAILFNNYKEEGDDDAGLVEHGDIDTADGFAIDGQHS